VSREKHGKNKIVRLTEKGKKVVDSISNIYNVMGFETNNK
jgi:predicted transcriptional regulator